MPIKLGLEDFMAQLDERGVKFDREGVDIIQESIDRIQRIIRRLLDFARNTDPDSRELDISQILDGIIKLNHKFFEHSRINIEAELPALPPIYGSKDQLEQVFMNLALNAQAAMPEGGTLWIKAYEKGDEIIIQFKDTGIGIPPENLNKIFDPFFSTKPNGTGLGLFVSYGIIQAHHGSIEVESSVDVGTQFTIHLPKYLTDGMLQNQLNPTAIANEFGTL
jgi:signal transduction histidine kinase